MALTFVVSLMAMALLFATLCKYELTAKHTRAQLRALRRQAERRDGPGHARRRRRAGAARRRACTATAMAPARREPQRPMIALLLAELPALPLHEAGKYVAGAYVVLFALVLVYVAIMAIRLSRIERDLGELLRTAAAEQASAADRRTAHRAGADARMSASCSRSASRTRPRRWRCASAWPSPRARRSSSRARRRPRAEVREAVVISTCNRTEVYLVVGDPVRAESDVLGLLARRAGIRPTELAEAIYSPRNCDAARQLYRVTAGLESMIVGEAEIQGQVRRAHEARDAGGLHGPALQPPVRGGADARQARALGDRDRREPRERPLGRGRPRAERARRASSTATS